MGTVVAIIDVSAAMRDRKFLQERLQSIAPKLASTVRALSLDEFALLPKSHKDDVREDTWKLEESFQVSGREFMVLSTNFGFVFDYSNDIGVIRLPCSWRKFCADKNWHTTFQNCVREIAYATGSSTTIYIADDSTKASSCLDLVYEDDANEHLSILKILECLRFICGGPNSDADLLKAANNIDSLEGYFLDYICVSSKVPPD